MYTAINPAVPFLTGDSQRLAETILEKVNCKIKEYLNKETMRVKVKFNKNPTGDPISGAIKLFILLKLKQAYWTDIYFYVENGVEYINLVASLTPEEKELCLS